VSATDHPQMTSKAVAVVFHGEPGSGSALMRDKPLQPEYRHNDCNDCTTLAFCFDGNRSSKHTTLQNQPGGPARQRPCSRIIALMCELCGGGEGQQSDQPAGSITASTLIAVTDALCVVNTKSCRC